MRAIIICGLKDGKGVKMRFKQGCKDGIPIMLGYLTVSFTFGVSCVAKGFKWWMPVFCSLTNFTGTGQFAGMDLIAAAGSVLELIATMLVINARYSLMAISLSQKLSPKTTFGQRLLIAFGLTDENYAVAMRRQYEVTFDYYLGVMTTSFSGWVVGTLLGALAGNILPESLLSAFGIALYGMFIAIVIPPCRSSKAIATVVLTAIGLSCLFYYTPYLKNLSSGWAVIICGISSALIGAIFFPVKDEENSDDGKDGEQCVSDNNSESTSQNDTTTENSDSSGLQINSEDSLSIKKDSVSCKENIENITSDDTRIHTKGEDKNASL